MRTNWSEQTGQRLTNPWPQATDAGRVQSNLDEAVFTYFFRKLFPGERGPRQAIINTFFQKLHQQCLAENIEPAWDPTNESRVNAILARLNFGDVRLLCEQSFNAGRTTGLAEATAPVQAQRGPKRSRRAASPAPEPQAQPASGEHVGDGASGTGEKD